jgi:hypothetical protein
MIPDRDFNQFNRLIRHNKHLHLRMDAVNLIFKNGITDSVCHLIFFVFGLCRHPRKGPILASVFIAQIEVLAVVVLDEILIESRKPVLTGIATPRTTTTRLGNHETVITVGDDVYPGFRGGGICNNVFLMIAGEIAVFILNKPTDSFIETFR